MSDPLALALAHLRSARFTEAELIASDLVNDPAHAANARHLLGLVALHTGRPEDALKRFEEAIALREEPGFHLNRGLALLALRRLGAAEDAFRRAVALAPEFPAAHNNLANALYQIGRRQEAVDHWHTAIRLRAGYAEARFNLTHSLIELEKFAEALEQARSLLAAAPDSARGYLLLGKAASGLKQYNAAAEAFRQALRRDSSSVDAYGELSLVLSRLGRHDEAEAAIRSALALRPGDASLHNIFGSLLAASGRVAGAIAAFDAALNLQPDFPDARYNKGKVLSDRGDYRPAIELFRQALRTMPDHREATLKLAHGLERTGALDEAVAIARKSVDTWPDDGEAWAGLGDILAMRGDLIEARAAIERAVRLSPEDAVIHSTLLCTLLVNPEIDDATLEREHQKWVEAHGRVSRTVESFDHDRDPDRPLRIGWLSRDFGRHILSRFLVPILVHHDPLLVHSHIYADSFESDDLAQAIRRYATEWSSVGGTPDDALARRIRGDRVDILVDLDGHCGRRLGVFAHRPAPIQVSYLGYPHGTGLPEIDYRLTDAIADPPGRESTEENLVRLSRGFGCFAPRLDSPPVVALPCGADGPLTFGATHKPSKLNDKVLDLWAEVLRAVPNCRLLFFRDALEGSVGEGLRRKLIERGAGREQILIRTPSSGEDYLRVYSEIDILLDVFPWCGHATACESLWQGAAVLTLKGDRYSGRMTASVLHQAGLDDWAVDTPEEYVATARKWAANRTDLANLRAGLRERMRTSPATNGKIFTKELDRAFRQMWRDWVSR